MLTGDFASGGRTLVLAPVSSNRDALVPIPAAGVVIMCTGDEWLGPIDAVIAELRAAAAATLDHGVAPGAN